MKFPTRSVTLGLLAQALRAGLDKLSSRRLRFHQEAFQMRWGRALGTSASSATLKPAISLNARRNQRKFVGDDFQMHLHDVLV